MVPANRCLGWSCASATLGILIVGQGWDCSVRTVRQGDMGTVEGRVEIALGGGCTKSSLLG